MFIESMHSLPFAIDDIYGGLAQVRGLLSLESDYLLLEYQVRDGLVGMVKSRVRELKVPLAELEMVTLDKRWLTLGLMLKSYRMHTLQDLPTSEAGRVILKLTRRDEVIANQLIHHLKLKISEARFERVNTPR
ncbi:hypothetical protein [Candidatus Cyanaurora vandensis]|uniref:hypothetical protein n=1 Tax=Candidatus Cyanaurora vandensis TaxID=2714958 RepID=UPI00257C18A1|nr:hypothetical protein [Candidatus Cyanaurora vandensis]